MNGAGKRQADNVSNNCIEIKNLSIGYRRPIITGINLQVKEGDYWGIIGPNGAGKTTLFKTILGLIPPLSGSLKTFAEGNANIAYVPQQSTIKTSLPITVKELILMPLLPLAPLKRIDNEILDRLEYFAEKLKIKHLLDKQICQTSGGEKQKGLICRALMMGSKMLLLDEPTNGMDIGSEKEILILLQKLNREEGYTILFITHFLANLLNEANQFAIFSGRSILALSHQELVSSDVLSKLYHRQVRLDCVENHYSICVGAK
jgi:ABC-type Mn2+/Zn2+ transport system ATPase subunit